MSVVIAYYCDKFSSLITDTRLSQIDGSYDDFGYDKITQRCDEKCIGFSAGIGMGEVIVKAQEMLNNHEGSDIRAIIDEVSEYSFKCSHPLSIEEKNRVQNTRILFTVATSIRKHAICMIEPNPEYQILTPDRFYILPPPDCTPDECITSLGWNDFDYKYSNDFNEFLHKAVDVFSFFSHNSRFVSPYFRGGIHYLNSEGDYKQRIFNYNDLNQIVENISQRAYSFMDEKFHK